MTIKSIYTYLVHPGKRAETEPQISGNKVALSGRLFDLLRDVYRKSDFECNIEISFNHNSSGAQQNDCRDLFITFLREPTLVRGRKIAERLEKVTTHRSGLGLLFLMAGEDENKHKLVVSRFPADSAILAEEDSSSLSVEFLERVFMKSATAYKAAVYSDTSFASGFWLGKAIDKQINSSEVHLSTYWILDFLNSDFRTTAAAGTRRLAVALRDAAKKAENTDIKSEIASAVTLARAFQGKRVSAKEFAEHFGLSESAKQALEREIGSPELANEKFGFDLDEFAKQVPYRTIELNTGGLLTAQSGEFNDVFQREVIDEASQRVRFSTEGKIVSEKLGKEK